MVGDILFTSEFMALVKSRDRHAVALELAALNLKLLEHPCARCGQCASVDQLQVSMCWHQFQEARELRDQNHPNATEGPLRMNFHSIGITLPIVIKNDG